LLLGPLAVKGSHVNRGLGRTLVAEGLAQAGRDGMQLVVLVGDRGYYARMGFAPVAGGQICFPGPVDPARILARELAEGALGDFAGLISAAR
jgi:predicted N-acetyltransferase YhbS